MLSWRSDDGPLTPVGSDAGIRDYAGDEFYSAKHYRTAQEALELFAADPLLHAPGTQYKYSTFAWTVVTALIGTLAVNDGRFAGGLTRDRGTTVAEQRSGKPFCECLRDALTAPLGLREACCEEALPLIPHRARPYHRVQGTPAIRDSRTDRGPVQREGG